METWYPIKLTTPIRTYLFGERLIVTRLGKRGLPPGRIAETWEVSDYAEDSGVVMNGPLAGSTLRSLVKRFPEAVVGEGWHGDRFPLLAKFLDASHMLPIHLHADDEAARRRHGELNGKTEAWHILECAPGATVLVGVRDGLTRAEIRQGLEDERWDDVLVRHTIQPGETVYVPGGVPHTFGPDTLIFEIQQTSDLTQSAMTVDNAGHPYSPEQRRANLDALMDEIRPNIRPKPNHGLTRYDGNVRLVVGCAGPYFALERWNLAVPYRVPARPDRCSVVTNIGEPVAIVYSGGVERLGQAETCLIPAAMGPWQLVPDGKAVVIVTYIPDMATDIIEPLRRAGYRDGEIEALGEVDIEPTDRTPKERTHS